MATDDCVVHLTHAAETDLVAIAEWVTEHQGPEAARDVVRALLAAARTLEHLPGRGRSVPTLGPGYRAIRWTAWRLIYRVDGPRVLLLRFWHDRRRPRATE